MKYRSLLLKMALLVMTAGLLHAQESLVMPVTRTFALKNVNIITKPGQMIEQGTVIIKDGLILAAGQEVKIPVDAQFIDADSMYVYAGFIDGLSSTGVPVPDNAQQQQQGQRGGQQRIDRGNPSNELAGIQPERSVKEVLKADDKSIEEMRKAGFTAAHVVPRGNMLPGSGAIVLLSGKSTNDMILRDQTSLFSQLAGAGRVYPSTVIAVMSKYRELYKRAEQAKAHEAMYAKNPAGMTRPNYDASLQAFYPVIDKKMPVFFAADDLKSVYRIFALQEDLKFPLVLANVKHGWEVTDMIKSKNVPVFLSLSLPKEKQNDKSNADQKEGAKKAEEQKPKTLTEMEMEKLEQRRAEEMKKYVTQAGAFEKAGIEFGFSAMNAKAGDVQANLRQMIENGLSEQAALAALTTVPAKLLGLSNIMGTVEKGKIANLVVTDKPYFAEKSNIRYVFVDGKLYEYEATGKKATDTNAPVRPAGKWTYSVQVEGQISQGSMEIKQDGSSFSGTISNPMTGDVGAMNNVQLKGNQLTFTVNFSVDGSFITVDFDLTIEGDTIEGTANAGSNGSFPVEGTRVPN